MNVKRYFALIVFCAAYAFGGDRTVFYVNTGTSVPMAPTAFKDAYSQGFNVGLAAGQRLTRAFEVQAMFHLDQLSFDNRGYLNADPDIVAYAKAHGEDPELDVEGGAAYNWNLSLNAKLAFPSENGGKAEPYIMAGAGVFGLHKGKIDISDSRMQITETGRAVRPASSETALGVTFGIGVEVMLDKRSNFFFELSPCVGFTSGDPTVIFPVKFGISFHGKTQVGIQVTNPDYP
jgi:hypothetical protein